MCWPSNITNNVIAGEVSGFQLVRFYRAQTYMSPIVNPVSEVNALVSKGCASSMALYLAQIPLIVGLLVDEEL